MTDVGFLMPVGGQELRRCDVSYGSIATEMRCPRYVRSSPDSDQRADIVGCLKRAINGSHRGSFDSMRVVDRTRISGP
jgi:hypothetical protein